MIWLFVVVAKGSTDTGSITSAEIFRKLEERKTLRRRVKHCTPSSQEFIYKDIGITNTDSMMEGKFYASNSSGKANTASVHSYILQYITHRLLDVNLGVVGTSRSSG